MLCINVVCIYFRFYIQQFTGQNFYYKISIKKTQFLLAGIGITVVLLVISIISIIRFLVRVLLFSN